MHPPAQKRHTDGRADYGGFPLTDASTNSVQTKPARFDCQSCLPGNRVGPWSNPCTIDDLTSGSRKIGDARAWRRRWEVRTWM